MKKYKLISLACSLLIFITANAFSQGAFSVHIGPAFPTGDFANDNPWDDHAGCAGLGSGFGASYSYRFPTSAFGIFAGADIIASLTSRDATTAWDDYNPEAVIRLPRPVNIPVSAGITYIIKDDAKLSLFGKAGLVASFFKYTGFTLQESGYEDYSEEYNMSNALGFVVGGGISGNHIILGFDYFGLGEHKISGTWTEGAETGDLEEVRKEIGLITITLGWKF